jgi:hypothetical protein
MEWKTSERPADLRLYVVRYKNGQYAVQQGFQIAWDSVIGWIQLPDFPSVS